MRKLFLKAWDFFFRCRHRDIYVSHLFREDFCIIENDVVGGQLIEVIVSCKKCGEQLCHERNNEPIYKVNFPSTRERTKARILN